MQEAAEDISVYGRGGESHRRVNATKRLSAVLPVHTSGDTRENRLGRLDQVTLSHGHVLEKAVGGPDSSSGGWSVSAAPGRMLTPMLSTDLTCPETRIPIKHLWDIRHCCIRNDPSHHGP